MSRKVAVILSGCGVYDGSEIHEAVSILIALDKRKAQITCLAPDIPQVTTVNHRTKEKETHPRNVLTEAARIARGKIADLASANAADFDAAILPGGFGAAINLCSFAADGANCKVEPSVEKFLLAMHNAGKPVGLACIAPVLAAAVFGRQGMNPELTIGTDAGTADKLRQMGAKHQDRSPTDVCVDARN